MGRAASNGRESADQPGSDDSPEQVSPRNVRVGAPREAAKPSNTASWSGQAWLDGHAGGGGAYEEPATANPLANREARVVGSPKESPSHQQRPSRIYEMSWGEN
jgi:hypothetical protein